MAYTKIFHPPVVCGKATFDPVAVRWSCRPSLNPQRRRQQTGVPGWSVLVNKDLYHLLYKDKPISVFRSWPIVRPRGDGVEVTVYCFQTRSYIVGPSFMIPTDPAPLAAPDASIDYPDVQNPMRARSFRGLVYGLQCDDNPDAALAHVIYSFWVPQLKTLVLVPIKGPPWIVMPGGLKAHLQTPDWMCRARATWSFHRKFLYVVGGAKSTGHRSSHVWKINLARYVSLCKSSPNLPDESRAYLLALRSKLAQLYPEAFDGDTEPTWWPAHPHVMKWRRHFMRGLFPAMVLENMWDLTYHLRRPVTEPAVRFIDGGRIMMVAGGLVSRESRTSDVEFMRIGQYGGLHPFDHEPQSFCPDAVHN